MVTTTQIKNQIRRFLPITVGLMVAVGFSFGILVSLPGFGGGSGPAGADQEFNATMPSQNYQEQPFDINTEEQQFFVLQEDIVFINSFYETDEQKEQLSEFQGLTERFDNRVYVSVANESTGPDLIFEHGLTDYPNSVVIGANEPYIHGFPTDSTDSEEMVENICDAFNSLGDQASECV